MPFQLKSMPVTVIVAASGALGAAYCTGDGDARFPCDVLHHWSHCGMHCKRW